MGISMDEHGRIYTAIIYAAILSDTLELRENRQVMCGGQSRDMGFHSEMCSKDKVDGIAGYIGYM